MNVIGAIKIHLKQQDLIHETRQSQSSKQAMEQRNETSKKKPLRKRSLIEFDLEELRNSDKDELTNSNQSMNSNSEKVRNDLIKRSTPIKSSTSFEDHQLIPNRDPGLLQPVDDLRFRTHHIQPFNLKK